MEREIIEIEDKDSDKLFRQPKIKDISSLSIASLNFKKSVEEVTGQNLDWFFRQWLYEAGYPKYDVKWNYTQRNRSVKLTIKQTQDGNLFKMPVKIKIDKEDHIVWVEDKEIVFEIPALKRPELVIFNSGFMKSAPLYHCDNLAVTLPAVVGVTSGKNCCIFFNVGSSPFS